MEFKSKMREDRSGISTVLIVIIVAVIVVVAAAAAYVVLSGDDNKEETVKETVAPGSLMIYEVSMFGTVVGGFTMEVIGQNTDEYFMKTTTTVIGGLTTFEYSLESKGMDEGWKKTGTTQIDTAYYGRKNVDIWELTEDGNTLKSYVDTSNIDLAYKMDVMEEGIPSVADLKQYEFKWQTSYEESESIGMTYEYSGTSTDGSPYTCKVVCVADCTGGKYGVMYDIGGGKSYFLCDNPQGLPADAVNKGTTSTIGSPLDGNVLVQQWVFEGLGGDIQFYYDSVTHIVYRFIIPDNDGNLITFNLSKKP